MCKLFLLICFERACIGLCVSVLMCVCMCMCVCVCVCVCEVCVYVCLHSYLIKIGCKMAAVFCCASARRGCGRLNYDFTLLEK